MNDPQRMDRREAIKWIMAATATVSLLDFQSFGATASAAGYGRDPDLLKVYAPGDLWPLTFTKEQRRTVTALCDVIIPADDKSPSASSVGVPDFIDEWISAPYPQQQADREVVLTGLAWLDEESQRRFKKNFADLTEAQQQKICDDICYEPKAKPRVQDRRPILCQVPKSDFGCFLHDFRRLERPAIYRQCSVGEIRRPTAGSIEVFEARIKNTSL